MKFLLQASLSYILQLTYFLSPYTSHKTNMLLLCCMHHHVDHDVTLHSIVQVQNKENINKNPTKIKEKGK